MEHVVFFPAHDGSPAFRRVGSLQDAVRLVEHLRNIENVSEVSVHSLAEVPLAFKPYYKVELPEGEPVAAAAEPEPIDVPGLAPAAAVAPAAPVGVPEQGDPPAELAEALPEADEKSGAASLGFFAS